MTDTVASNPFAPLRWLWGGGAASPQSYGPSIPPQTPPWFPRVPLVGGWGWGDFRPARTELAAWFGWHRSPPSHAAAASVKNRQRG